MYNIEYTTFYSRPFCSSAQVINYDVMKQQTLYLLLVETLAYIHAHIHIHTTTYYKLQTYREK